MNFKKWMIWHMNCAVRDQLGIQLIAIVSLIFCSSKRLRVPLPQGRVRFTGDWFRLTGCDVPPNSQ